MKRNTFQVKVTSRGTITLPRVLRKQNKIEEGDVLTMKDLGDGVLVIRRRRSGVDEIADQLAEEWRASGETLESMLAALRAVRAKQRKKP